jgi:hypothetical protein
MRGMLAPDEDASKASSHAQTMIEDNSQPVRILVVDDDPAMQHMVVDLSIQLTSLGILPLRLR